MRVLTRLRSTLHPIKWSNTLTQFVGNLQTNCLSVFDHFAGLALEGSIFKFAGLPDTNCRLWKNKGKVYHHFQPNINQFIITFNLSMQNVQKWSDTP